MPRRRASADRSRRCPPDGRARAVIEAISPAVDGGRFAVKRIVGDRVDVEADCFADGHDMLACVLRHRREGDAEWRETPMAPLGNDRWRGDVHRRRAGSLSLHGHRVGRRVPFLAPRFRAPRRRRRSAHRRARSVPI